MIVLDANLLLYAYVPQLPFHAAARRWLESTLSEEPLVGIPWQSIGAFLRVATNPRLSAGDMDTARALGIVSSWLVRPYVHALVPGEQHWQLLKRVLAESRLRGPRITDAQLAAITMEYGGVLHTTDRDFARFPGLHWTNPLDA